MDTLQPMLQARKTDLKNPFGLFDYLMFKVLVFQLLDIKEENISTLAVGGS
jgi:hypothetical protein